MVQWLRIHLSMQETQVRPRWGHSLTCCGGCFVVYGGVGPAEADSSEAPSKDDVYLLTLTSEAPNPRQKPLTAKHKKQRCLPAYKYLTMPKYVTS